MHIKGLALLLTSIYFYKGCQSQASCPLIAQQSLGWLSAQPVCSHGMQSNCKYWLSMNHVNLIPWKDTCKFPHQEHIHSNNLLFWIIAALAQPFNVYLLCIYWLLSLAWEKQNERHCSQLKQAHKMANRYSMHQELLCLNPPNCLVAQLSPTPFTDGNNKSLRKVKQ